MTFDHRPHEVRPHEEDSMSSWRDTQTVAGAPRQLVAAQFANGMPGRFAETKLVQSARAQSEIIDAAQDAAAAADGFNSG